MSVDTITGAFDRQAARYPDRIGVTGTDGAVSYAELQTRANRLAHYLQQHGVRTGDVVAVHAARSVQLIVMLLAVVKAGAAYLAVDERQPAEYRRLVLADAGVRLVLVDAASAGEPYGVAVLCPERESVATAGCPATPPEIPIAAAGLAYVAYTSGSTGRPKGVAVPHRAVVRLVVDADYVRIGPEDVLLQFAPVAFDASTLEIWGALLNGGRVAVAPPGDLPLPDLLAFVRAEQVTVMWLTAGLFHRAVELGLPNLPSLRYLLAGGDVLSPAQVDAAMCALPAAVVVNGYDLRTPLLSLLGVHRDRVLLGASRRAGNARRARSGCLWWATGNRGLDAGIPERPGPGRAALAAGGRPPGRRAGGPTRRRQVLRATLDARLLRNHVDVTARFHWVRRATRAQLDLRSERCRAPERGQFGAVYFGFADRLGAHRPDPLWHHPRATGNCPARAWPRADL